MFKNQLFWSWSKMFRIICAEEKYAIGVSPCSTHPHNFYIQLLAETGIIGFIFLFTALLYVIYSALKQFKSIVFRQKRFNRLSGLLVSWNFNHCLAFNH